MKLTKLITHANCADGLATAMIVRDALPEIEIVFAQYGTPSLDDLPATTGLLFCDITPPRERIAEFVDAGAIVLDHHAGQRDIVEAFGVRGVFADEKTAPGVSGAMLAYEHVWRPLECRNDPDVHQLARLTGIRDTWQRDSPSWELACDLQAALLGMPEQWWTGPGAISRALSDGALELGRMRRSERREKVERIARAGTLALEDRAGRRWAAFPDGGALTSDVAEALRESGAAHVTCGWFQRVSDAKVGALETVLSLRSDGSLDVAALCRGFGGGGHTRAAGCRMPLESPLEAVRRLIEAAP